MSNKTLKTILANGKKLYVLTATEELCHDFLSRAEREGFVFGDGSRPTEKHISDLFALTPDMKISYVTTPGRIAFSSGTTSVNRIDYSEFLNSRDDVE